MSRRIVPSAILCLLASLPAKAQYTFTPIADTSAGAPFSSFVAPSINARGAVAFRASLRTGVSGIFRGDGVTVVTVADTSPGSPFRSFATSMPSINAGGTVAFQASLKAGIDGILTSDGTTVTPIATTTAPYTGWFSSPSINDAGVVAFFCGWGGDRILTGNGGPLVTVADTNGPLSGFGAPPSINDDGTVAVRALLDTGGQAIVSGNGGQLNILCDTSGAFGGFGASSSINNARTVAFLATLSAGGLGIFTGSGGPAATAVVQNGAFQGFNNNNISINDAGRVAFTGTLPAGNIGIFTGPDPVADKVIAVGDTLLGRQVSSLSLSREALSETGQIAFHATLSGGASVIVRADPARVPAAPKEAYAYAVSSSRINLFWGDDSADESGFKIERWNDARGRYEQIATVGANVTRFRDAGLAANTTYWYRVQAYNAAGNSDYSNEAATRTRRPKR